MENASTGNAVIKTNDQKENRIWLSFKSRSENVSLARMMAAAIAADRDMTVAELDEIRVAVSEAVSNAIIHGYENRADEIVELIFTMENDQLTVAVHDDGIGIENIEEAMEPHFSGTEGRMGLGFAFMHSFMDKVDVESTPGHGTTVTMVKRLCRS